MVSSGSRFHKITSVNFGVFAVLLVFMYVLSNNPFIFESFIPRPVRIAIEGSVLLLLTAINLNRKYVTIYMFWIINIVLVYLCMILFEISTLSKLISSFNKLAFLLLIIGLLIRNQRALQNCIKIWIRLSYFLCVMTLIAFIGYNSAIISFVPTSLGSMVSGELVSTSYHYLHHNILGNILQRNLFGIELGRVSGIMYEPGYLAFYLGFNILVARDWIDDTRLRKRFVWLNIIAGIATLSTLFFFFFTFYFLIKKIKSKEKYKVNIARMIVFLALTVFIIVYVLNSGYIEQTSLSGRLNQFRDNYSLVLDNNWLSLLLGNDIGIQGSNSGWESIFIEKGVILLTIIFTLFFRLTKHNLWLMLYVIYCNIAIKLFFIPLFLFLISMSFAYSYKKKSQPSDTNVGQINFKMAGFK